MSLPLLPSLLHVHPTSYPPPAPATLAPRHLIRRVHTDQDDDNARNEWQEEDGGQAGRPEKRGYNDRFCLLPCGSRCPCISPEPGRPSPPRYNRQAELLQQSLAGSSRRASPSHSGWRCTPADVYVCRLARAWSSTKRKTTTTTNPTGRTYFHPTPLLQG